jgi:hypothetical protein
VKPSPTSHVPRIFIALGLPEMLFFFGAVVGAVDVADVVTVVAIGVA